jgi:23S rRNA pseudouridine1911/1915/1917 synthase
MEAFGFKATPGDDGDRLDVVIARHTGAARAVIAAGIKTGVVTLNGRATKPSHRVSLDDLIEGEIEKAETALPQPEAIDIEVRYSDDRVLVVAKPAGLVTHPGSGNPTGTLVNALLAMGIPLSQVDPHRPGIVHRLDKDTSGLLLVAKDDEAHLKLQSDLRERKIDRRYLALVRGVMDAPSGAIEAPIGRHPTHRRKMTVTPEGRDSVTHFKVLAASKAMSYLEVDLESGRTHQIRVHLSHIRHPVLGDALYGGLSELSRSLGLQRPFLHATRLSFPHPSDGEVIEVTEPLPPDLQSALDASELLGEGPAAT